MFHKSLMWIVIYPITLIAYFGVALLEAAIFLFNSPVDVWILISEAIDGVESHDS